MFWADISEFVTLIKDHGLIFPTEQGRGNVLKKTTEFGWRIPGKFVPLFLGGGRVQKAEVSSQCLSR
jgi:hypothetical protein